MNIRVNDTVMVIAGDDKSERGRVLKVDHHTGKIVVERVNRVYKHVRRNQKNPQGGRLSKEMPIPVSNVMLVCPKCGQPTRVGARFRDDGSKERYCKKCGVSVGDIAPPRASHAKK